MSQIPQPTLACPSAPAAKKASGYLPTLDGWRAIAILLVMADHAKDRIGEFFGTAAPKVTDFLDHDIPSGVQVFFGISGFLITYRLLEEHAARGKISLRGFYLRRAFRILPPVLLYLACAGILGAMRDIPIGLTEWASALGFFANYTHTEWYLGHFWSLAVEEHFYLLWPAILLLSGVRRGGTVAALLALAVCAWRFLHYRIAGLGPITGEMTLHTDIQADGLLWGCVLAFVFANPLWRKRFTNLMKPWVWAAFLVAAVAVCVVNAHEWLPHVPWLERHGWLMHQATWASMKFLLPVVVVGTVMRPQTWVGRFLEWAPLRWIGRISYGLYLWQQLFYVWDDSRSPSLRLLQSFPLFAIAPFIVAAASYYVIERPLMRLGHRLAHPPTPGRSDLNEKIPAPA